MTEELGALLASFGADTEMHWHPGGHELGQDHVDAARLEPWFPRTKQSN